MIPQWTDHPTDVERDEARLLLRSSYRYAQKIKRYPQNYPDWLVREAAKIPRRDDWRIEAAVMATCVLVALFALRRFW
jgi:hypothetical protein